MARSTFTIDYDESLVSARFMADHMLELEGVTGVDVDEDTADVRNLARFTTADAETVLGRPLTLNEERRVVKTLANSSMGEVFAECVEISTTTQEKS